MLVISRQAGQGILINDDLMISVESKTRLGISGPREKYKVRRAEKDTKRRLSSNRRLLYDDVAQEWLYVEVLWREASKQEAESRLDLQDAAREV